MTERETATEVASKMRGDLFDKHGGVASRLWAKEGVIEDMNAMIAIIISQARSQAYEECAKIADEVQIFAEAEYKIDPTDGPFTIRATAFTAKAIAKAIRQHSQKGEGNE